MAHIKDNRQTNKNTQQTQAWQMDGQK